jgi:serine O-acetyltransferase
MDDLGQHNDAASLMADLRSRHPRFTEAVLADTVVTAQHRGERYEFRSKGDALLAALRLAWVSDAFLAQVLYRAKAAGQRRGIPVLPRLCHRLSMIFSQVTIGDPVVVHPGVYIVHGQVVLDGIVEIHSGVVISPWVTIGLKAGNVVGPTVREGASIGTGAKLIGPIDVGAGASIGAGAVVVDDVPAGETATGVPARHAGKY